MKNRLVFNQLGVIANRFTQCLFLKRMKGGDATHTGTASLLLTHTLTYTRRNDKMTKHNLTITHVLCLNVLPLSFLLDWGPNLC